MREMYLLFLRKNYFVLFSFKCYLFELLCSFCELFFKSFFYLSFYLISVCCPDPLLFMSLVQRKNVAVIFKQKFESANFAVSILCQLYFKKEM